MNTTYKTNDKKNHAPWARVGVLALSIVCLSTLSAGGRAITDTDILNAVHATQRTDDAVPADRIDVEVQDGVVTLDGTVGHLLARERAQEIAEAITGVRAIVNLIDVDPVVTPADTALADSVTNAWLEDPAVYSYELHATAEDGVVTLTGTVDSYAKRELAETVAKGVWGVQAIENEIAVEYELERQDFEIEREIEARLQHDVRVDDGLITVEVDDGVVTLSGSVGSLQEKSQARSNAWVAGVDRVEDDELIVEYWRRDDDIRRRSEYLAFTDEEIREAVRDAFRYDPRVSPFDPVVTVSDGTVTLSGTVDNLAAKRAAGQTARNTMGVVRVNNYLDVRPDVVDDVELQDRVEEALEDELLLQRHDIRVSVHDSRAYLAGDVDTSYERNRAERAAEGVRGVVDVVNNITYEHRWIWSPDREIRENVRDRLRFNALVDEGDIELSVDDGVVTLSGTVDSWTEQDEAERSAYQGGAKTVENELTVRYPYYGPRGPGYYGDPYYRVHPFVPRQQLDPLY